MTQPVDGGKLMPVKKLCVFGDGISFGIGDSRPGGWPARLAEMEMARVPDLQTHNLCIPWQTTPDIAARWRQEAEPRLSGGSRCGVVFSFGLSDMVDVDDQGIRVALFDSSHWAEKMVGEARHWQSVLWIGPPPMLRSAEPREEAGHWVAYSPARLAALNEAFATIAADLGVPYLDLCAVLGETPEYRRALIDGDGVYPAAAGHRAIAETIAAWEPWHDWFPRPREPRAPKDPGAFQPLFFKKARNEDKVTTAIL